MSLGGVRLRLVALLSGLAALAGGPIPDDPTPEWREAPIRYILNLKEDNEYKGLKTVEDRRAFIERFWAALDPTPESEANERRAEFWKRVEEAGRLFPEMTAPGFKSDRGKVYVLMGPPDRRASRGLEEIWTYVAQKRVNAAPEILIHFRRNSEGEFHVRPGDLVYRDPLAKPGGTPAGGWYLAYGSEASSPQIIDTRIRMTDFPKGEVTADEILAPLALRSRVDSSKAEHGATHLVMTFALAREQFRDPAGAPIDPDLALSMQVETTSNGAVVGRTAHVKQIDTPERRSVGLPVLAQAALSVRPGSYRVVLTMYDRKTHLGSRVAQALEVPAFGRGLSLSSVVVGRLGREAGSATGPFENGQVAFAPEPDPEFRRGESVTFAYQVYAARTRRGQADLEVTYRFQRKEGSEFLAVGKPLVMAHLTQGSIGYSVPLAGWPSGDYRLAIEVRDALGGGIATGQGEFRVAPDGSPR